METESLSVDETVKNVQAQLASIKEAGESARAAAKEAVESQRQTVAALADAQTKLKEIAAVVTQAVAAKTQIADEQAVIATKSDHIQKAQEHADAVRANLDRTLTAATQQATEAEGQKARAQSAVDTATELLTGVRTTKAAAEKDAEAALAARKTAEESAELTKGLAEKSATVEAHITEYERQLADLQSQCAAQLKTIEGLLPGATSTGLAHAFNDRRTTFLKPQNLWQFVFVGSVLAIVGLTASGLMHFYQADRIPTYDELGRLWLARLPVVGALVWLAIYASRESALAKRLEEDYGYKSAISSCFEGFRKQLSEIGKGEAADSPLGKLCTNTLTIIASPPGRIYDKHKLTVSPAGELTDAAKGLTDVVAVPKA
jgi:hypothetical protein